MPVSGAFLIVATEKPDPKVGLQRTDEARANSSLPKLNVTRGDQFASDCIILRAAAERLSTISSWCSEAHLRDVLKTYASYHDKVRPHLSLDRDAPDFRGTQNIGGIAAIPNPWRLHHQYVRL
jgi:hypothetical protein